MMKNVKSIRVVLIVFILVSFDIGWFACLNKPSGAPLPGGQIIVKQSGGTGMLIKECTDKSYITQTADYIIEGTVDKVESQWSEGRTGIFTYTDLRIENYVKGTPFAQNELQIVTPGGTVGGITQAVEDQPIFHVGKKVRIYFEEVNGEFSIVCGPFGVEER
jgi:hypothetical protein